MCRRVHSVPGARRTDRTGCGCRDSWEVARGLPGVAASRGLTCERDGRAAVVFTRERPGRVARLLKGLCEKNAHLGFWVTLIHGGAMSTSRRDFAKIAGTATAAALLSSPAFGANEPALGLIFPPKDYPIPPDAKRLYPTGVEFLGDGVGLPGGMTIQGYEEAIPRVVPVAEALAKRGAKVISVFGSSITFYKGAKFNEELTQRVTKATGLPATTQSNGLVDGLKVANAKRVAVATA